MAKHYYFTAKDYEDMERRRNAGEKLATIALTYGCTGDTISKGIINRTNYQRKRTWRNEVTSRENGVTTVALYHHNIFIAEMLIDTDLEHEILAHNWRLNRGGYAVTSIKPTGIPFELHRLFYPAPHKLVCDHRNRNRLDNRLCNLRHVTQRTNLRNSAKYDNVSRRPKRNPNWGLGAVSRRGNFYIASRGRRYIGIFTSESEARRAAKVGVRVKRREYRGRGQGAISFHRGAYQVRYSGIYIARFPTEAEAEKCLNDIKANPSSLLEIIERKRLTRLKKNERLNDAK